MKRLPALLSAVALASCSVVGIREEEEPAFQVVGRVGPAELRRYGERIAAETVISGDERDARSAGFRRIASYIFGANTTRTRIAMTAPVAQETARPAAGETIAMTAPVTLDRAGDAWRVRFFMPAKYTMETLPTPNDPQVRLALVPAETVAVLRFTGSIAPEAIATRREQLLSLLSGSEWRALGTPVAWFYDPPWTIPFLRRNEVAVDVRKR